MHLSFHWVQNINGLLFYFFFYKSLVCILSINVSFSKEICKYSIHLNCQKKQNANFCTLFLFFVTTWNMICNHFIFDFYNFNFFKLFFSFYSFLRFFIPLFFFPFQFLQVISYWQRKPHRDVHRFEKISNIIKQFKLSCTKVAASFQSMEVRNSHFAAFVDAFTSNTYVMVIMSDSSISEYQKE